MVGVVALLVVGLVGAATLWVLARRSADPAGAVGPAGSVGSPTASVTSATLSPAPTSSTSDVSPPATTTSTTTETSEGAMTAPAIPARERPSLVGDARNAWAFVPLDDPSKVTIEGSVPSQRAWSTSKVLVAAAYLQVVAQGDPSHLDTGQTQTITKALTESDGDAVTALHDAIPGGSGEPVNAILRSIGDDVTFWPNSAMNSATWTIDRQLTFLVALHEGRVVNPAVSAYLISMMRPVPSESWGLGTVGASAFKGGWVSQDTETRQMGFLHGYAVVIITAGEGPAIPQIDGDSAHVDQMNRLAALLEERLRP